MNCKGGLLSKYTSYVYVSCNRCMGPNHRCSKSYVSNLTSTCHLLLIVSSLLPLFHINFGKFIIRYVNDKELGYYLLHQLLYISSPRSERNDAHPQLKLCQAH